MLEAQTRDAERERDRLVLDHARRRDELDLLHERIVRDLEIDAIDELFASEPVEESPEIDRLEREISRKREHLHRIGSVGEEAIEQYEQEAERFTFLQRQLDDVRRAGEALGTLMHDLERTMADKFDRTSATSPRRFR
jgi:chromosome segregation protein